jgi:hypothetical protein
MNEKKKAGRSNGVVRETAEFHIDQDKYEEGYKKVFGKEDKKEVVEELIDPSFYYLNKLFVTDRAKVVVVDDKGIVTYKAMINGMENNCRKETFLKYWKISKIKIK